MKQPTLENRKQQVELIAGDKTEITLHNGKKVKVGYICGDTQDKIDYEIVKYDEYKNTLKKDEESNEYDCTEKELCAANKITRQFYAKCVAHILLNHPIKSFFLWRMKWRYIYYFSGWSGEDYLKIIAEAKKKAQEQEYNMAMVFLMDMTTTWTMMTKKEAEEYRHELELAREAQSLRNSQH